MSRLILKYTLVLIPILLALISLTFAYAQDDASPWSEPYNLSNSGASTDPHIIADSQGRIHVLWVDEFDGLIYTRIEDGVWIQPFPMRVPFDGLVSNLKFDTDHNGYIHAIWLDEESSLYYSRVREDNFGSPAAWSTRSLLALAAADADFTIGTEGRQFLVYARSEATSDFPSGVYVMNGNTSGSWNLPQLLYASPYYRGLKPDYPLVSIAYGDNDQVYAAWDDTQQERVYLAHSEDAGDTWGEPNEIDRRRENDGDSAAGPSGIVVIAQRNTALMIWGAGHQRTVCSLYYQWTIDAGGTWSDPEVLPDPFESSCPSSIQLLLDGDGSTWMFAASPSGSYLLAWNPANSNGELWTTPQLQAELSGFVDPETYRYIPLDCLKSVLVDDQLFVAACQKDKAGDIWTLSRGLQAGEDWFPTPTPTPIWSTPVTVTSGDKTIRSPVLFGDHQGRLHAFWVQEGDRDIYYALWDGEGWTRGFSLLNFPGGQPDNLTAVIDPNGFLFLVGSDASTGEIYYSHVPIAAILNQAAWSLPQPLPVAGVAATSPEVMVGNDGLVQIAFAVPLNEGRGIYLIKAIEPIKAGEKMTWSPPSQVFDAALAGWGMVDMPRLGLGEDGTQHVLWIRSSVPPASESLGLYYASSIASHFTDTSEEPPPTDQTAAPVSPASKDDVTPAGTTSLTWSPPVEVDSGHVLWSQILSAGDGTLHRAWQSNSQSTLLWHQYSLDGGLSWSKAVRVGGFEDAVGPVGMVLDASNRLHMIQIGTSFNDALQIQHWRWGGGGTWEKENSQDIPRMKDALSLSLLGDVNELRIMYSAAVLSDEADAGLKKALLFMGRELPAQNLAPATLPTFTPFPQETVVPGEVLLLPTPTPTLPLSNDPGNGLFSHLLGNQWTGLVVAALPAVLVVLAVFVYGVRKLLNQR